MHNHIDEFYYWFFFVIVVFFHIKKQSFSKRGSFSHKSVDFIFTIYKVVVIVSRLGLIRL